MSIMSMTGFGQSTSQHGLYQASWEIKSVNNRFKEIKIKLPHPVIYLENKIRQEISKKIYRGTIDVNLNLAINKEHHSPILLDFVKIKNFVEEFEQQLKKSKHVNIQISPSDFLIPEFLLNKIDIESKELEFFLLQGLDMALSQLIESRSLEGMQIQLVLEHYVQSILEEYKDIEQFSSEQRSVIIHRLQSRWNELKQHHPHIQMDEQRFLQEVVYYLEKLDIHEEIERMNIHLKKIQQVFLQQKDIGKTLEFTTQELHREINTLGSKSQMVKISQKVVNIKVLVEKIREQILNIE